MVLAHLLQPLVKVAASRSKQVEGWAGAREDAQLCNCANDASEARQRGRLVHRLPPRARRSSSPGCSSRAPRLRMQPAPEHAVSCAQAQRRNLLLACAVLVAINADLRRPNRSPRECRQKQGVSKSVERRSGATAAAELPRPCQPHAPASAARAAACRFSTPTQSIRSSAGAAQGAPSQARPGPGAPAWPSAPGCRRASRARGGSAAACPCAPPPAPPQSP